MDLESLAQTVAQRYGDDIACAIVTRQADTLCVQAQWSSGDITLPRTLKLNDKGFTMFHHNVARALPIIIDGASAKLERDPLAKSLGLSFYAAAPLTLSTRSNSEYEGVLAIVSRGQREEFTLTDAEYLTQKAVAVADVLRAQSEP
eukprot:TRINITY_DN60498_c0_g1_i1.p1 TRINITY_DN60498_c0_g1~~TRINITY_DN60498_c0_g1_i1.p1  ORF type:complete len:146 (+),score=17.49 TRINITY_DN60498_c0_g1_i1:154-591(+)